MSGSVRPRLVAAAAVLSAACLGVFATAALAATVPNPCKLLSPATIASTVGLKGVTLTGILSTRPDGAVKQSLCTFTHGTTKIEIMVAPHQPSGGSGGPPGMHKLLPSGLGSGATDYYDTTPPYTFANVSFTKGNLDATAYDSGTLPNDLVVELARLVYKALP